MQERERGAELRGDTGGGLNRELASSAREHSMQISRKPLQDEEGLPRG